MSDTIPVCPHCGLPAVLPDVCTPAVNDAIERRIAKDGELFTAGYVAGQRAAADLRVKVTGDD